MAEPSTARGETTPALLEETIGANFEATVARHPEREALVEVASGRRWTWAELDADVDALARGLVAAGVEKGDRVGIWSPNCAEWTLTQYATAKIGAILVNINPAYRTHELAYAVNQSGLSLLISASVVQDQRLPRDGGGDRATRSRRCEQVVYLDTDEWADHWSPRARAAAAARSLSVATLDAGRPDQHPVHLGHDRAAPRARP